MGPRLGERQGLGSSVPRNEEKTSLLEEVWPQSPPTSQSNTWPGASISPPVKCGCRSKGHVKMGPSQPKPMHMGPEPALPHLLWPQAFPATFGDRQFPLLCFGERPCPEASGS